MVGATQKSVDSLSELLHSACRPVSQRKIGVEIERIGVWKDGSPFTYNKNKSPHGVGELLEELGKRNNWEIERNPKALPLGLNTKFGHVSLEPGAQVELSTHALTHLGLIVEAANEFEQLVGEVSRPWGVQWIGLGLNPFRGPDQIELIPSHRYDVMTRYIEKQGALATSMMRLTSSIQINLDYSSEEDAIEMLRVGLAAAPISHALFGNSPIYKNEKTDYLSFRKHIWDHTDPDRVGLFAEAFESNFNFRRYSELTFKRPMMFAFDGGGVFVPCNGKNLTDIAAGAVANVVVDDNNLMSGLRQLFTEARIKPGYVEVRSVDGHKPSLRYAAAAFWTGLLYDGGCRASVLRELGGLTGVEREELSECAAQFGLKGVYGSLNISKVAEKLLHCAKIGLANRGFGEEIFLAPIDELIRTKVNHAERALQVFENPRVNKTQELIEFTALPS